MSDDMNRAREKQQYKLHQGHSAVKLCHWVQQSLLKGRPCYKQEFYGIRTHRCLQMTPVVNQCSQNCLFCWRVQGFDDRIERWSEPEQMLDACIEEQRKLVSGFGGDSRCSREMWKEAREPRHVAISLSGEPTIYPYLSDFIELCHRRGMTTFLVTNGTFPEALERLDPLPTQLYVTVAAPNEEIYKRLCVPRRSDGWGRLMRTLELMPSLDTRTVIRHTLVKGWNLGWEDDYSRLDAIADPLFIEPKGYVFVGDSRRRMRMDNMPSHGEIVEFSHRLGTRLGLDILKERKDSRVLVLGRDERRLKIPGL